jgi:hypothetical protein
LEKYSTTLNMLFLRRASPTVIYFITVKLRRNLLQKPR